MTKKRQKTEVVAQPQAAVAIAGGPLPDYMKKDSQRGSESVGTEDIIIPRLEIVQALSPSVKDGDPKYNPDARPGMLINSVTGRIYGKDVMVIPVMFIKQWLVWRKRKDKNDRPIEGGFFGAYNTPDEAYNRAEKEGGDDNHIEVIDTPQHLCLLIDPNAGTSDEIMVSMPRTKAKVSRQWNSLVRMVDGDRFSSVYRVTTALEKNARGDYYNYVVGRSGWAPANLYSKAEDLYNQIRAGMRKVAVDNDYDHGTSTGDSLDEEI